MDAGAMPPTVQLEGLDNREELSALAAAGGPCVRGQPCRHAIPLGQQNNQADQKKQIGDPFGHEAGVSLDPPAAIREPGDRRWSR